MAHGMSGADVRTRGATQGHPIARQADARSKNAIKNENNIALNPRGATRTRSHAAAKLSTRAFASSRNRFAAFGGVRPFEHCVAKAPELETRKARPILPHNARGVGAAFFAMQPRCHRLCQPCIEKTRAAQGLQPLLLHGAVDGRPFHFAVRRHPDSSHPGPFFALDPVDVRTRRSDGLERHRFHLPHLQSLRL